MLKVKNLVMFTLAGMAFVQACNSDKIGEEQTTESGLKYKYITRGEEQKPDSGKIMILNMVYKTEDDSVLFDYQEMEMPFGMPVKSPEMKGMIFEGLDMLHKGDSVEFKLPAKNFYNETARMPVPAGIKEDSDLIFRIGVKDVITEEAFREIQMEQYKKQQELAIKQQELQLGEDINTIEEFLKENNIEAQKTESGLYYVINKRGKGPEVNAGDAVTVHYRGKLLDGTQFDASYDRGEPFTLPNVGEGRVIRGWDEGLQQLKEGSKATFYIPSPLGYGARGQGPVIKPNSILVFDIEVLDVEKK